MVNFYKSRIDVPSGPRWWVAAALFATLALFYAGLWFYLALGVREAVVQWIDQQRERGFSVRYDSFEATGFPLSIKLEFINPGFGAPNAASPWGWEGARLELQIRPWNRNFIQALTSGQQMLAFPMGGNTEAFTGEVTQGQGEVMLTDGDPVSARIVLGGVDLKSEKPGLGIIKISAADISLHQLEKEKTDHQTPTWALEGSAEGLSLPWLKESPLGAEIQAIKIDSRLMGSLATGPLIESLENWRDGGGTVEILKFNVQNGPLKINAEGTLALDGSLQPTGAMTAHLAGFFETVDALKTLNIIKPRAAITAKMVLGVLARKPKDGGPSTLNLALTLQERSVYAGPVSLMKLPQIDWRALAK